MKKKLLFICALLAVALCGFAACSSAPDYSGKTKVTYLLEGGKYQETELPVVQYYDFREGTENLIVDPTSVTEREIERPGYTLTGWYRTRTEEGGNVTYADQWNFATDKVTTDGITLYAGWKKTIQHTYNVCYRDKDGNLQIINTYTDMAGKTFEDYMDYAHNCPGHTFMGKFFDEDGNPWDPAFVHPGGETDLAVNVVGEYIEGEYELVGTADELRKAVNKNIYLTAEIDFEGGVFGGFVNYNGKTFEGNGFTVKNFTLDYSDKNDDLVSDDGDLFDGVKVLNISLFGIAKDATVRNVTFTGVTIDVKTTNKAINKILVAPLFGKATGVTADNVHFAGSVTVTRKPNAVKDDDVVIVTDKAYYVADDKTTVTKSEFSLTKAE